MPMKHLEKPLAHVKYGVLISPYLAVSLSCYSMLIDVLPVGGFAKMMEKGRNYYLSNLLAEDWRLGRWAFILVLSPTIVNGLRNCFYLLHSWLVPKCQKHFFYLFVCLFVCLLLKLKYS